MLVLREATTGWKTVSSSEMNPSTISSGNTTTTQKLGRRPTYTTSELLSLMTDFKTERTSFGMKFHYEMECSKACFPELPATLCQSLQQAQMKK
jgi:hypothetical protein